MLFLANENFPGEAVEALQERGHDVAWVHADAPGADDQEVLERAQREKRIVITLDKDFGELAFRFGLPSSSGIILFRIQASSPKQFVQTAIRALEIRQDWSGHFTVVEEDRIRMRPLPGQRQG